MSYRIDFVTVPRTDFPNLGWVDNAAKQTEASRRYAGMLPLLQSFVTNNRRRLQELDLLEYNKGWDLDTARAPYWSPAFVHLLQSFLTGDHPKYDDRFYPPIREGWNTPYVWASGTFTTDEWPAIETLLHVFKTLPRSQKPFDGDYLSFSIFPLLPVPFDETTWPAIESLLRVFSTDKRKQLPFIGDFWASYPIALDPQLWPAIAALLDVYRTRARGGDVRLVDDTFIIDWINGILLVGTHVCLEDIEIPAIGLLGTWMAPASYLDNVSMAPFIDPLRKGC